MYSRLRRMKDEGGRMKNLLHPSSFILHPLRAHPFRAAFTLIEMLIVVVILGILATIVVPQFSNASVNAKENTLKDELRYLRTQVIVYKAQHHDVPPGYPNGDQTASATGPDFIAQLTRPTDETGITNATSTAVYKFGPYLSAMPSNP